MNSKEGVSQLRERLLTIHTDNTTQ